MEKWERVTENIRKELKSYIQENRLRSLVLGVSGGIDSALCAALAAPVCKDLGVKLIGRSLPCVTNRQEELDRAELVGKAFCDDFKEVNLEMFYENAMAMDLAERDSIGTNPELDLATKIRFGNIKARLRMMYLYNLASRERGLVLSTDNMTELQLGFWTLHGDHADYGMFQMLWKTEVYDLANYLSNVYDSFTTEPYTKKADALDVCIQAMPTDGLGVTDQGDLGQIMPGGTYTQVDEVLKQWLDCKPDELKDHPVVLRHEASHFKRKWPINLTREQLFRI
jgi:NAD+ synthase